MITITSRKMLFRLLKERIVECQPQIPIIRGFHTTFNDLSRYFEQEGWLVYQEEIVGEYMDNVFEKFAETIDQTQLGSGEMVRFIGLIYALALNRTNATEGRVNLFQAIRCQFEALGWDPDMLVVENAEVDYVLKSRSMFEQLARFRVAIPIKKRKLWNTLRTERIWPPRY